MTADGNDQTSPALAGAKVLIVKDEALVALELALALRDLGCIVLGPAADSTQARALLQQRPDVVLLDLGLQDGFALTLVEMLGLAPWEWRGEIRTSCGSRHGDRLHAGPGLGRGTVAQGRVQPLPVVEDFDVIEHGRFRLRAGAEADVVDVLLLQ